MIGRNRELIDGHYLTARLALILRPLLRRQLGEEFLIKWVFAFTRFIGAVAGLSLNMCEDNNASTP